MNINLQIQKNPKGAPVHLLTNLVHLGNIPLQDEEKALIEAQVKNKIFIHTLFHNGQPTWIVYAQLEDDENKNCEALRQHGATLSQLIAQHKITEVGLVNHNKNELHTYSFLEGLVLASYRFLKYKSNAKELLHPLKNIAIEKESYSNDLLKKSTAICAAIFHARDLVNEPHNFQSATQLSDTLKAVGKEGMVKVSVYGKAKIEQLGMGGLLAVNKGSLEPPTFTIMEHKPSKAKNTKPIVLVGKGVVYDTGGLSLKPTPNSMDKMKSDMGGAAVVAGIMYALGSLDIPLHVIALIPATDNRPGGAAYAPGDVIKMYSGQTVEVLNTDAEGRMLLADALHFAKKYQPEFVADFATLTGAAANAIGDVAMVAMGTIGDFYMNKIKKSGFAVNEKVVELPLWEEYGELIKSDVADMKNIGGPVGGAITAGKFLEKFTDYPWVHFDVAGVTFRDKAKHYLTAGGTGYGIRMMVDYLSYLASK